MRICKPPMTYTKKPGEVSVFLAGSIEMGAAAEWQTDMERRLADIPDLLVLNPRREDWDSSWKQEADNPQFAEQVNWEMDAVERKLPTSADIVYFYFDPKTLSPITQKEWGMVYNSGWAVICCPVGFWRRGNLEIDCKRAGIRLHDNFDDSVTTLRWMIELFRGNMSY